MPPKTEQSSYDLVTRRYFAAEMAETGQVKKMLDIRSGFNRWKPLHFLIFYDNNALAKEVVEQA